MPPMFAPCQRPGRRLANLESGSRSGGSSDTDIGLFNAGSGLVTVTSISLWSEKAPWRSSRSKLGAGHGLGTP